MRNSTEEPDKFNLLGMPYLYGMMDGQALVNMRALELKHKGFRIV